MATIILLASDHNCGNAAAAAFYLANAYNNHQIKLFNYLNSHLYRFNLQQRAFVDLGLRASHHRLESDIRYGFSVANNGNAIGGVTFARLGKLTRYADAMTTLDPAKLPEEMCIRAQSIISTLIADDNQSVCFVIAPNGRNVPSRLLTFGHKLSHGAANYSYQSRSGGVAAVSNVLNMINSQVLATLIEILLCQAIARNERARYLGNCYGSQIMWVALGGGLTTYKRNNAAHNNNMVWDTGDNDEYHPQISWDDGIFLGNGDNDDHPTAQVDHATLFGGWGPNITYNTDFHHSYMMILSKALEKDGAVSTLDHDLRQGVVDYALGNAPQRHLARMRRYAQTSAERYDEESPKRNRTWNWVGVYQVHGRIFGFQGHPIYHITQFSAAWDGNTSVQDNDDTAENQHHASTRNMVQKCMFG
jgi:hypothetical protein